MTQLKSGKEEEEERNEKAGVEEKPDSNYTTDHNNNSCDGLTSVLDPRVWIAAVSRASDS